MARLRISGARGRLALTLLLCSATAPALAQYPAGATVQQLPRADDPAELLAQALRTLATEPNNIAALTAAGHNALVLGDPNAAVGFFGHAAGIAPRDGPVKAGLGSALVQLEKPAEALRLFGEASALGVPDADLAEDRGLAYDLSGDTRRAQRDYMTVLAAHPEDDTARRRLALSQGIAGDRAAAIATLDPLIRKRDIAGWRAQTFVLAMNGDAAGASSITHIMMPQQADRMQPFLIRLSTLSPADKARAVHFGEMPQAGSYTPTQLAATNAPATYAPAVAPAAAPAAAVAPASRQYPQPQVAVEKPASAPSVAPVAPRPTTAAPTPSTANQVAVQTMPAPLAGTAFAAARTPSAPVTPAQPSGTTPASVSSAPAPAIAPAAAPSAALPVSAPVGHYDLPHDAAARASTAPRAVSPRPEPRSVAAPIELAPVKPRTSQSKADAATSAEKAETGTRERHARTDEMAEADTPRGRGKVAASKTVSDGSDDQAAVGKHGRWSKTAHVADDSADGAPAKSGRSSTRKGGKDDSDTADSHDRKSKKGAAARSDDADDGGSKKHG